MIEIKEGAEIDELHPLIRFAIIRVVQPVYEKISIPLVITSGHEGVKEDKEHGWNSKHYKENTENGLGEAVDIRNNNMERLVFERGVLPNIFQGLDMGIFSFEYRYGVYSDLLMNDEKREKYGKLTEHFHLQLRRGWERKLEI